LSATTGKKNRGLVFNVKTRPFDLIAFGRFPLAGLGTSAAGVCRRDFPAVQLGSPEVTDAEIYVRA
jgi:hypothetical protein